MESFELPIHYEYRKLFLEKFFGDKSNIIALSNCYGNYKSLGVVYSPEIMDIIYRFDDVNNVQTKVIENNIKEIKPVQFEYYHPNNYEKCQDRVSFKFVVFVKSCEDINLLINNKNVKNFPDMLKYEDEIILPESIENLPKYLSIEEAIENEKYQFKLKDLLCKFADQHLQNSQKIPPKVKIHIAASKSKNSVKFDIYQDQKNKRLIICDIVMDKSVLLASGRSILRNNAIEEAEKSFREKCMLLMNIQPSRCIQQVDMDESNNMDPEIDTEMINFDDFHGEIYPQVLPQQFYIKTNNIGTPKAIFNEAMSYFRISTSFNQNDQNGKIELCINKNTQLLARMDYDNSCSLNDNKNRLILFAMCQLQKTCYTLIRNAMFMDKFDSDNSIEKGGMYEKNENGVDPTKLDSKSNLGGIMMLKMGWMEGRGLGQKENAIVEPIIESEKHCRSGIGFINQLECSSQDKKLFHNNVINFLMKWSKNDEEDDLIFDRQLDNKERAVIHKEARKLGLFSKSSNNVKGDRFLVVTKNRDAHQLLKWVQQKGGATKLYTLIKPTNMEDNE